VNLPDIINQGNASTVQGIFPIVFVVLFVSSAFFPRETRSSLSASSTRRAACSS